VIFKFAADTRKMQFRYSKLCGAASDAVGAVELEIPQGYKFLGIQIDIFPLKYLGINHSQNL